MTKDDGQEWHRPDLSVVVPVYNEEENLPEMYRRLCAVLDNGNYNIEFVFVDDGSTDGSVFLLKELQKEDSRIVIISLSRNYGHQIGITAGLDNATGKAVVTMDADLQDPPEVIPEMINKWQEGFDVVTAVRLKREGERFLKKTTASVFYRLLQKIANVDLPVDAGDFRLMDHRVVAGIRKVRERHRYIRGIVSWMGFRHTQVSYKREPRFSGASRYPMLKSLLFAIDAITTFSYFPLRLATGAGLVLALLSIVMGMRAIYLRLFTDKLTMSGWAALFVAITFIGALQLIVLGVVGEYLGRTYEEIRGRPLYYIERIYRNAPELEDEETKRVQR